MIANWCLYSQKEDNDALKHFKGFLKIPSKQFLVARLRLAVKNENQGDLTKFCTNFVPLFSSLDIIFPLLSVCWNVLCMEKVQSSPGEK